MNTRLERELKDFFITFDISKHIGLQLFNEWLAYKLSLHLGLNAKHFKLTKSYSYKEDDPEELKERVAFYFSGMDLDTLEKTFSFFKIEKIEFKTGYPTCFNQTYLFETLLTDFKKIIQDLVNHQSKKLLPYQVASQRELGMQVLSEMEHSIEQLLKQLNPKTGSAPCDLDKKLTGQLIQLRGFPSKMESEFQYSDYLLDQSRKLQAFLEKNTHYPWNEILKSILNSLDKYIKFNHVKKRRFIKQFREDLELYLNQNGMTAAKSDVFEQVLCQLAGITSMPKSSSFDIVYSGLRFYFKLEMPGNDLNTLIEFFKSKGDDSACKENEKISLFPILIPGKQKESTISPDKTRECTIHTIEVDGEWLATVAFNEVKQWISENPDELIPYQDKSKKYLAGLANKEENKKGTSEAKAVSPSQQGLFSVITQHNVNNDNENTDNENTDNENTDKLTINTLL